MKKRIEYTTLLQVVKAVQDHTPSDREAVAVLAHLLNNGRITFTRGGPRRDIVPLAA